MSNIILIDDREFRTPVYTEENTRALGGPGSGNFGHAGRPGEVGGSSDDGSDIGGSIRAQKDQGVQKVGALLDKAVASTDFTVNVKDEDYEPETTQSWDAVSSAGQDAAEEKFKNNALENGVDVDDSDIIQNLYEDLYKHNDDVVEKATAGLLEDLKNPNHTDSAPFREPGTLPFEGGVTTRQYELDPDTIEVEADEGDGATLNEDALRLTNGEPLNAHQLEAVDKIWTEHYTEAMDQAKEKVTESDAYYEQRNQLEYEAVNEEWNNLSDDQKLEHLPQKYLDESYVTEEGAQTSDVAYSPGPPDTWIVDTEVDNSGQPTDPDLREDYNKTRILARSLANMRTEELLTERGLSTNGATDIPRDVWSAWKGSSTSNLGLALQLAAAEELGGHHRLTPEEEKRARETADTEFGIQVPFAELPTAAQTEAHDRYVREFANYEVQSWKTQNENAKILYTEADVQAQQKKAESRWEKGWDNLSGYGKTEYAKEKGLDQNQSGMDRLKAYTRAQWETTQFLMDKAGQSHAEVYRGIILPKESLDATTNEPVKVNIGSKYQNLNEEYVQLPDIEIKRNGASSTSSNAKVSNEWGGAGGWSQQAKGSQRAVLRFRAPATSIISLPVFGQNLHNESEYVMIGTRDKWEWDVWRGKAPTFKDYPMHGKSATGFKAAAEKTTLVIDMAEHDKGPHWLTDYREQRAKPRYAARRKETAVHAAADAHHTRVRTAMAEAFTAGQAAVNVPLLRSALQSGNRARAAKAVAAVPGTIRAKLMKILPAVLLKVAADGGQAGLNILRKQLRTRRHAQKRAALAAGVALPRMAAIEFDWGFDPENPRAQKWAREHAAELAKGLSDTTRDDIADALVTAFEGTSDTNTLIDDISEAVGDEDRGRLIADTETMIAANEGQREGWRQAIDEGVLPEGLQREWITTGDMKVCPECESLEGTTADVDGLYPDPGGDGPPQHPRCRCTEGIAAGPRA